MLQGRDRCGVPPRHALNETRPSPHAARMVSATVLHPQWCDQCARLSSVGCLSCRLTVPGGTGGSFTERLVRMAAAYAAS